MQSDPALHTALLNVGTPDNAFDIAYHMYWPNASDPWNLANPQDNLARKNYYNVTGTPTMKCDGFAASWPSIQTSIQGRLPVPSPLWIDLDMLVNAGNLEVTATVVSNTNISGNYTIHIVLMERYVYLVSPNSMNNHYHPMLDMQGQFPGVPGQVFSATANDTVRYYGTFVMNPSWEIDNLDVAAFVQYNTTKEILQAYLEQVPVDFPNLVFEDYTLEDDGNNDGRAEPGEEAYMYVTLSNGESYQTAINVVGTLSTSDPDLTVTTPTVNFPDIPNGGQGTNVDPFIFEVSPTAIPHYTTFQIEVIADPQQTVMTHDIEMYIGWPDVLLIDDDGFGIVETYYQSALQALNKSYEDWDTSVLGTPTQDWINQYPIVIWMTGWASVDALTADEQLLVEGYLDNGGMLFLCGQNIAQGLTATAPTFLQDILHATLTLPNTQVKELDGIPGNPVGDGLSVDCNPGGSGSGTCTSPDGLTVLTPAETAFTYIGIPDDGALTYDHPSNGKLVFFALPFEAINGVGGTNTREDILAAIFEYFGSPATPPEMVVTVNYVSGSPVPAGGGNLYYGIWGENQGAVPLDWDGWIDMIYEGSDTSTVINREMTNYLPGWQINRPDMWYPVPGGWPGGNYELRIYSGWYPEYIVWHSDFFNWVKEGAVDLGYDFDANLTTAGFPDPFDEVIKTTAEAVLPSAYEILGAYPNPFNPATTISFALPQDAKVMLSVYDISGRLVSTLVDGHRSAGVHDVTFDASNLSSGIYLYRLDAGEFNAIGKMVLMK